MALSASPWRISNIACAARAVRRLATQGQSAGSRPKAPESGQPTHQLRTKSRPRHPTVELSSDVVPEGWPRGPKARFDIFPTPTVVERAIDDVISAQVLDPLAADKPLAADMRKLVLLDGERGVGKSTVLLRAVQVARSRGIVTMYIPSARTWTHGGGFFSATSEHGKDPIQDGHQCIRYYDRPTQTLHALQALLRTHGNALAEVPSAPSDDSVPLADREELKTLRDVTAYGVEMLEDVDKDWRLNPRIGGDVFQRIVLELSAQSRVPFMIAIDDYDAFLGMTALVSADKRSVHANSIRAVGQHFGRRAIGTAASSMQRGVILAALGPSHGRPNWKPSRVRGTLDYPITDDLRKDPSGAIWLTRLRAYSKELPEETKELKSASGQVELVPADWKFDPLAVSATEVANVTRFIDVPELTKSEVEDIFSDFEAHGLVRELRDAERDRMFTLAGGRADILHGLCKAS